MAYDPTKDPNKTAGAVKARGAAHRAAAQYSKATAITPSDSTDLAVYANQVQVATAGTAVVIPSQNLDADAVTYAALPIGFIFPFQIRRVKATGTTAVLVSLVT